jgi:hypothetical protein
MKAEPKEESNHERIQKASIVIQAITTFLLVVTIVILLKQLGLL